MSDIKCPAFHICFEVTMQQMPCPKRIPFYSFISQSNASAYAAVKLNLSAAFPAWKKASSTV